MTPTHLADTMVVRISRAIDPEVFGFWDAGDEWKRDRQVLDRMAECRKKARAVLAAMREPSGAMLDAGKPWAVGDAPPNCWLRMIDAALSESRT